MTTNAATVHATGATPSSTTTVAEVDVTASASVSVEEATVTRATAVTMTATATAARTMTGAQEEVGAIVSESVSASVRDSRNVMVTATVDTMIRAVEPKRRASEWRSTVPHVADRTGLSHPRVVLVPG